MTVESTFSMNIAQATMSGTMKVPRARGMGRATVGAVATQSPHYRTASRPDARSMQTGAALAKSPREIRQNARKCANIDNRKLAGRETKRSGESKGWTRRTKVFRHDTRVPGRPDEPACGERGLADGASTVRPRTGFANESVFYKGGTHPPCKKLSFTQDTRKIWHADRSRRQTMHDRANPRTVRPVAMRWPYVELEHARTWNP
jgi:hypothetical protein